MVLPNLDTIVMPTILLACLVVGFILKQTPVFAKFSNDYIPTIVAVLGALLAVWTQGFSLESLVFGAISGLASTGLHQAFLRLINSKKEDDE